MKDHFLNFFLNLLKFLVQERLTSQIANAIKEAIDPKGVGVVVEAT